MGYKQEWDFHSFTRGALKLNWACFRRFLAAVRPTTCLTLNQSPPSKKKAMPNRQLTVRAKQRSKQGAEIPAVNKQHRPILSIKLFRTAARYMELKNTAKKTLCCWKNSGACPAFNRCHVCIGFAKMMRSSIKLRHFSFIFGVRWCWSFGADLYIVNPSL